MGKKKTISIEGKEITIIPNSVQLKIQPVAIIMFCLLNSGLKQLTMYDGAAK